MLVVDNGDAIRGIAEVASKLDFTVNGFIGTTPTQLADGQLGNSEADMYLSGANSIVVASITIVNTDSAARTFTLYLKPSAGTSRAITPVSLDLGVGHSFYTDGQRILVLDLSGNILSTATVLAHDLSGASHTGRIGKGELEWTNAKLLKGAGVGADPTEIDVPALSSKAIYTTRDMTAASGAVSYTGVGFQPTAYRILAWHSNVLDRSDGHLDSGAGISGVAIYDGGVAIGSLGANIIYLQTASSVLQYAVHTSFDADGVTLTYTKIGSPTGTGHLAFSFFK